MRTIGMVFVLIGALVLGFEGSGHLARGRAAEEAPAAHRVGGGRPAWVQPVLGGIAVVGGLLLLVTEGRRE